MATKAAGVALALATCALATATSGAIGRVANRDGASPAPAAPLAIAGGALLRRRFRTREAAFARIFEPGARACADRGLKLGIAALGAKLSLREIGETATAAAPATAATVTTGLAATPALRRAASERFGPASGLTRKVGALLAAGTSVCGVTAIGGLAPAIGASQREIGVAVANVAAYGTLGMLAYPWAAKRLFPEGGVPAGVFLGLSVHDTAQVVGAGMTFRDAFEDEMAFKAATVTKLTRNLTLALAIPYLAYAFRSADAGAGAAAKRPALVPGFLIAFVAMAALRSLGDATESVRDDARWKRFHKATGDFASNVVLPTSMAAVGLCMSASALSGVGVAPFVVGACAATSVGVVAACSVKALDAAGAFRGIGAS